VSKPQTGARLEELAQKPDEGLRVDVGRHLVADQLKRVVADPEVAEREWEGPLGLRAERLPVHPTFFPERLHEFDGEPVLLAPRDEAVMTPLEQFVHEVFERVAPLGTDGRVLDATTIAVRHRGDV